MAMQRRQFLKNVGLGLAALGSLQMAGCSKKSKPNVLFIFADDQCHEALSAFGSQVQTPNLDKLVKNGVTFTNAYNMGAWNGAVCIASRTMLNTGRFLWHAEKLDNEDALQTEKQNGRLWSQLMKNGGYTTYFTGKWHVKINPEEIFDHVTHVRPGMPKDHYDWSNPSAHHVGYDRPVKGEKDEWSPYDKSMGGFWEGGTHWSQVLGDDSVKFMEQAQSDENPFFMYLAFNAPHDPRQSPKEFVEMYPAEDMKVPENFQPLYPQRDEMGCGYGLRDARLAPFPRTKYATKVQRQEYYALITHMDKQVGRILNSLEKSGKKDNTYIFFTADHGMATGQHGLFGKQNMYEHSVKPPLVVNGPGIPKNETSDAFVYLQDIMATTLDIAGIDKPNHVHFNSLLPVLKGKTKTHYSEIYGAYLDKQRMVRSGDYKLIIYPTVPVKKLFNLNTDPLENENLLEKNPNENLVRELEKNLVQLQKTVGDTLTITDIQ